MTRDSCSPASPFEQLRKITDALLGEGTAGEHHDAAVDLNTLLSTLSGLTETAGSSGDDLNTSLPVGEALSPADAARCVVDSLRTSKFLRGNYAAIHEALQRFTIRPIEILYAGCGPFATLAIPLMTQFQADEIQFTLLDIHPRSLSLARKIVGTLGLTAYVREYVQCDAAAYVHPRPLQMVITETMQQALSKETQVAITLNLAAQLCPGGIFIPERVTVDAYLSDPRKEFMLANDGRYELLSPKVPGENRFKLGRVFELTAEKAIQFTATNGGRSWSAEGFLPAAVIALPSEIAAGLTLMLATTVSVFETIVLEEYESGITHPRWFFDFQANAGDRIEFQYCFKGHPGFKWHSQAT